MFPFVGFVRLFINYSTQVGFFVVVVLVFFLQNLSSSGCSYVGWLFDDEKQKKLGS